ncbi:hypothetical protein [Arcobacter sp. F2176]|uniref:hypothetical protein n=1 Tax=Arcobacter sp. F2176 TaxID=2044511 RepID=UPI00100C1473|nr:hypothetical protein [Arcobacter sp. F2176]RXJ79353.1 hypothetical protein CRU95_14540 [Arcobacter sp. F2176]
MKKLLILILSVFFTTASFGATENIHQWIISSLWRTSISLTNACNTDDVDVSVQFWKSDGSLLTGKQISEEYITDSNGKISLHLKPHQSIMVNFEFGYFDAVTYGSGTVTTSYVKPGVECLIGGYYSGTTIVTAPNPYGQGTSYLLNSGKKF